MRQFIEQEAEYKSQNGIEAPVGEKLWILTNLDIAGPSLEPESVRLMPSEIVQRMYIWF